MTGNDEDSGLTARRADLLHDWLIARGDGSLPRSSAILRAVPELGSIERVGNAFRSLARQGRIEQRHGTIRAGYGHRIVRIVTTGAVLRTEGCPLMLEGAGNPKSHRVGHATLSEVLRVVEECATQRIPLPRPGRLGKKISRSAATVRNALAALHDDGRLILRQRGMRQAAELPDGRTTL
jgi:hypothetical protein